MADEDPGLVVEEGAPEPGPSELESAVEFMRREGLEVPENLIEGLRGDPVAEEPAAAEEPEGYADAGDPGDPGDEQPAADSPQRRGWEARRAGLKKAHEDLQREHENLQRESQESRDWADAMLQLLVESRKGQAPPAAAAQEPVAEEPAPDWLEDPDAAMAHRLEKVLEPYKKAIAALIKDKESNAATSKVQQVAAKLREASAEFSKQDPAYPARMQAFEAGYVADLMDTGRTEQEARETFYNFVNGSVFDSIQRGKNPIAVLNRFASRYYQGNGSEATMSSPPAPRASARPAPAGTPARAAIDAALAASAAGAARPTMNSAGEAAAGPVSVAALAAGRVRPQDVKELLKRPGGTEDFWRLAEAAEKARV